MKFRNNILKLTLALLLGFSLLACGSSDDDNESMDIVEIAIEDGRFETLVAALQAAGLDDDLAGEGPFTVFAPTDDAFNLLPPGTVETLLEPGNLAVLIDLLQFHVYDGELTAGEVIDLAGTAITMLNGLDLRIDFISGQVILSLDGNREAVITQTNIEASNGIIHVIDAVLDPEDATTDIVQTAIDNGNFTTLVAALEAGDLDDDLAGEGPFTVFAPTDAAFNLLPPGTVANLLLPANQGTLIDILLYHVYDGSVLEADAIALDGSAVTMFNGADMSINVVGTSVVLNQGGNRAPTVTQTNVLTSNGVIHVIDAVLDPGDAPAP